MKNDSATEQFAMIKRTLAFSEGPLDGRMGNAQIPATTKIGSRLNIEGHWYRVIDNSTTRVALETGHPNLAVGVSYVGPVVQE